MGVLIPNMHPFSYQAHQSEYLDVQLQWFIFRLNPGIDYVTYRFGAAAAKIILVNMTVSINFIGEYDTTLLQHFLQFI